MSSLLITSGRIYSGALSREKYAISERGKQATGRLLTWSQDRKSKGL